MSRITGWVRANANNNDFVSDQRAWVVLVTDVVALVSLIGLLATHGLLRDEPYSTPTLIVIYLVIAGASVSLLLLRFVGYHLASHTTVAAAMLGVWFLNTWYAGVAGPKTDTVYLVAVSALPALLLGRVWMIVYGAGTLLVISYVASVLGRSGVLDHGMVLDYLVDSSLAVVFVVFFTFIISDIYSRALNRVRRLLDRQQRQNEELVRMRELCEVSESQKRQFYRDTIFSITDGKLSICDVSEIRPLVASADVSFDVLDAASTSAVRHEVREYLERQGLTGELLDSFAIAVGEAITNMVKHANGGRVYVGRSEDSVWVACEDHGSGIESLTLPRAVLLRGFSTKPSLGLGYSVILEVADRVLLKTDETGTTVALFKRVHPVHQDVSIGRLPDTWT